MSTPNAKRNVNPITGNEDTILKIKHDMKLLAAVGKSRMAKSWHNREILWSELLDKLSTTTRTRETVTEYAAMSNQFTPYELQDRYPVDRLMHDIALTLMAVQTQTTSILSEFPTKAAPDQPKPTTETNPETTPNNETAI